MAADRRYRPVNIRLLVTAAMLLVAVAATTGCSWMPWVKKKPAPAPFPIVLLTATPYEPQLRAAFFRQGIELIHRGDELAEVDNGLRITLPAPREWCLIGDARKLQGVVVEVVDVRRNDLRYAAELNGWTDSCLARRQDIFAKIAKAVKAGFVVKNPTNG